MVDVTLPKFPELTFEPKKHIYKLNGIYIPSVTTVMRPLSNEFYKDVDEDILNAAADRGRAVHNGIENYVKFEIEDIAPQHRGYFDGFLKWMADFKPIPIETECRVYHKYLRYAGTADMPCVIDKNLVCVDFKTSAEINRMLTGVQLEAYSKAYESHGVKFDEKAIVHLKSDGTYSMERYKANDSESWEVFGALLTIWNHQQKYKRR